MIRKHRLLLSLVLGFLISETSVLSESIPKALPTRSFLCSSALSSLPQRLVAHVQGLDAGIVGVTHLYNDRYLLITPWGIVTSDRGVSLKGDVSFSWGLDGSFHFGMNPWVRMNPLKIAPRDFKQIEEAFAKKNISLISQIFSDGFASAFQETREDEPPVKFVARSRVLKLSALTVIPLSFLLGYFFVPTPFSRNAYGESDTFFALRHRASDQAFWMSSVMSNLDTLFELERFLQGEASVNEKRSWYTQVMDDRSRRDRVISRSKALDEYFKDPAHWAEILPILMSMKLENSRTDGSENQVSADFTQKFWRGADALPAGSQVSLRFVAELVRAQAGKSLQRPLILESLYQRSDSDEKSELVDWRDLLGLSKKNGQVSLPSR